MHRGNTFELIRLSGEVNKESQTGEITLAYWRTQNLSTIDSKRGDMSNFARPVFLVRVKSSVC